MTKYRGQRAGFSLIELLAVVAIIGVLAGLIAFAVGRVRASQAEKNTNAVIAKLASALDQQMKAVIDETRKEPIPTSVTQLAGGDPIRARVIWTKLRLRQEFPMSFAEAIGPVGDPFDTTPPISDLLIKSKPAYAAYLATATSPAGSDAVQNSVCLLMALSQARRGQKNDIEELVGSSAVAPSPIGPSGAKMLVDGWGNPIVFSRSPAGQGPNAELGFAPYVAANLSAELPVSPAMARRDPQDPEGTLYRADWSVSVPSFGTARQWFNDIIHPLGFPLGDSRFVGSANITPVVMSAGPDEVFATPTTSATDVFILKVPPCDDIYSYRLRRAGEKGGN